MYATIPSSENMSQNQAHGEPCYLLRLPPEIIILIYKEADPDDLASLAVSCKKIYAAGVDVLNTHRVRISAYQVTGVGCYEGNLSHTDYSLFAEWPLPIVFLKDVMSAPIIRSYLKHIHLTVMEPRFKYRLPRPALSVTWRASFGTSESDALLESIHKYAAQTAQQEGNDEMLKVLHHRRKSVWLAALIILAPKINHLTFHLIRPSYGDPSGGFGLFGAADPVPDQSYWRILQHLRHVTINDGSGQPGISLLWNPSSIDLLLFFAAFPSIQRLTTFGVSVTVNPERMPKIQPRSSNVEDLRLYDCRLGISALTQLIGLCRTLRKFTLTVMNWNDDTKVDVTTRVVDILKEIHCDTLENLALTHVPYANKYLDHPGRCTTNLQSFKSLKTLRLARSFFLHNFFAWPPGPKTHHTPHGHWDEVFPSTIQRIDLMSNDWIEEEYKAALAEILRIRDRNGLENLNHLHFGSCRYHECDERDTLWLDKILNTTPPIRITAATMTMDPF